MVTLLRRKVRKISLDIHARHVNINFYSFFTLLYISCSLIERSIEYIPL
jgi:hypothetical protein